MTRNAFEKFKIIRDIYNERVSLIQVSQSYGIPIRTLQRWLKQYQEKGLNGLERQNRADKGRRRLSEQILEYAQGLALEKPKKSIASIYRAVEKLAKQSNEPPPSYHSIYKVIKLLPESMFVLAHQGDRAYEETFDLLYIREATRPNEIWQADHTLLDINVINEQGKAQRPWLTVVLDDFSRSVPGYFLMFDAPTSLQTALALRQAIWCKEEKEWEICGIPEQLYTDHGSDFTSEHIETVCADLKIQLIFSAIGKPRGRGKNERFFNTLNQKFLCELPGYLAKNAKQEDLLTLQELDIKLKDFIIRKYHLENHSMTKEKPIDRWRNKGFLPHLPESLEKLDLLLLHVARPRKVHQDGIRFQGFRYIDPVLSAYVGEAITIRYDPRDMAEIRVFYENNFLCRALCQELTTEKVSFKDIQKARRERKRTLKEAIKKRVSLVDHLLFNNRNGNFLSNNSAQEEENKKKPQLKIKLYEND